MRRVKKQLNSYHYVVKSDIKSFYASVGHGILIEKLNSLISCKKTVELIERSIKRTVTYGGLYFEQKNGLAKGSPLSPYLGALYLADLDKAHQGQENVYYISYMGDFVALFKKKSTLRAYVKRMLHCLHLPLGEGRGEGDNPDH